MPIVRRSDWNRRDDGSSPGLESFGIVDADRGSDHLRVGEVVIAAKSRVPRHTHTNTEEAMVLLEGELQALVGSHRGDHRARRRGARACRHGPWLHQPLRGSRAPALRVPDSRTGPGPVNAGQRSAVGIPVGAGPFRLPVSPRPASGAGVGVLTSGIAFR